VASAADGVHEKPVGAVDPGTALVRSAPRGQDRGMPTPPDPHQDANYQSLIDALAREGLPRRTEAVRAVEAVMCALAQRISGGEFEDLRELLPDPFRGRLAACERHAAAPPVAQPRSDEAFYAHVAEDLGREATEVEPTVRAVFAAIRGQVGEKEAEDVAAQLPSELQALWRRPS
jgi:uncharacterized protein (DUF2267 family)